MRGIAIFLAVGLATTSTANGAEKTAYELLAECRNTENPRTDAEMTDAFFCLGYISGFSGAAAMFQGVIGRQVICSPSQGIPNGQTLMIFKKYAEDFPEQLHESARSIMFAALTRAFPCGK